MRRRRDGATYLAQSRRRKREEPPAIVSANAFQISGTVTILEPMAAGVVSTETAVPLFVLFFGIRTVLAKSEVPGPPPPRKSRPLRCIPRRSSLEGEWDR